MSSLLFPPDVALSIGFFGDTFDATPYIASPLKQIHTTASGFKVLEFLDDSGGDGAQLVIVPGYDSVNIGSQLISSTWPSSYNYYQAFSFGGLPSSVYLGSEESEAILLYPHTAIDPIEFEVIPTVDFVAGRGSGVDIPRDTVLLPLPSDQIDSIEFNSLGITLVRSYDSYTFITGIPTLEFLDGSLNLKSGLTWFNSFESGVFSHDSFGPGAYPLSGYSSYNSYNYSSIDDGDNLFFVANSDSVDLIEYLPDTDFLGGTDTLVLPWESSEAFLFQSGADEWQMLLPDLSIATYTQLEYIQFLDKAVKLNSDGSLDDIPFAEYTRNLTGPVNNGKAAFTIQGSIAVGQSLTAARSSNDPDGNGVPIYDWQTSSNGSIWTSVGTSSSYTIKTADQGKKLRVIASYIDSKGFAESSISAIVTVPGSSGNSGAASFSIQGTAAVGQTLSAVTGSNDPDGNGFFTYTWQSSSDGNSWGAIGSSPSYLVKSADQGKKIRLLVTYTDLKGFAESVTSNPVSVAVITNSGRASFSIQGTAAVGQTLSAVTGSNDPDGNGFFTYTWQSSSDGNSWGAIGSSPSYLVKSADQGKKIRLVVTYTDLKGFAESVTSNPVSVAVITNSGPASFSIQGTAAVGQTLSAVTGSNDPDGNGFFTYTWQSSSDGNSWGAIGSSPSYLVKSADQGKKIRLVVTYTDLTGFAESVTSNPVSVAVITNSGPASFSIQGTAAAGQTLSAVTGSNDPDGNGFFTYTWQSSSDGNSWGAIGSSPSYLVKSADQGKKIRLVVTYTDLKGFAESVTSNPVSVAVITNSGRASFSIQGTAAAGQTLSAVTGSNDPDGNGVFTYTWQSSSDGNIWGAIGSGSSYLVKSADQGKKIRLVVTYTDLKGFAESVTSNPVSVSLLTNSGPASFAIQGTAAVGQVLTVLRTADDPDGNGSGLKYTWQSSSNGNTWTTIGTNQSYTVKASDQGNQIRAIVTYNDGINTAESLILDAVAIGTSTSLELLEARVVADLLTLVFDQELADTKPSINPFTVLADGNPVGVFTTQVTGSDGIVKLQLDRAIRFDEQVTIQYRDLSGDQSTGVIQAIGGADMPSFTKSVTNLTKDTSAPTVSFAAVDENRLTIQFDEAIASKTAPATAWAVREEDRFIPVQSVATGASPEEALITLTLSRAVSARTAVTLAYTDLKGNQSVSVVEDLSGNDLASFRDVDVENRTQTSTAGLQLDAADVDGDELTLSFNRELDSTRPSAGLFRVTANGERITVSRTTTVVADRQVVLDLSRPVSFAQKVLISYDDATGDQRTSVVQDLDGNDLTTLIQFPVKNNTRKASVLGLESAEVINKELTLTFSEPLGDVLPSSKRFRISADNKNQRISRIELAPDNGVVNITLLNSIQPDQNVVISYSDLGGDQLTGIIEDSLGNDLASFRNRPVSNFSIDEEPPIIRDALIDGRELTLEFDEELKSGKVPFSRFILTANDQRIRLTDATVATNSNLATMNLGASIDRDSTVQISYRDLKGDQKSGVIQDLAGNDLAIIRNFPVELF